MRTFSELLREYIGRTGVSDAELARAVGVQRQTVFRWKEGLVARPRTAEDVLHLAAKLRLTPAERDELLLAAGFAPVTGPPPQRPAPVDAAERAGVDPAPATRVAELEVASSSAQAAAPAGPSRPWWLRPTLITFFVVVFVVISVAGINRDRSRYPRVAAGETLVVIAQFGNYTGGNQGYNVAGRLNEALERELAAAGLKTARAAVWPDAVTDPKSAADVVQRSGAALLIWGEYDTGRVVARFLPRSDLAAASRELSLLAASPSELPTVINSGLPGDIRYLALTTLAQVYLHEQQPALARAALGQAGQNLPTDPSTRMTHYFLWGYANQIVEPPDLDAAIEGYTEALKLDDGMDAAHNNRGVAYLGRRGPGDLAGAVEDLTRYLEKHDDDAAAHTNRGSAYFLLGGPDNLSRALDDLDRAIAIDPSEPAGYYNRGLVYIRLDAGPQWRADLERALALANPATRGGLCWGYSLSDEPAKAIEYCLAAIKAGGDAGAWENLGVAYARAGQIADGLSALETYRERLAASGDAPAGKMERLDAWVSALKAGRNPIDAEAVKRLREE